jgi:integrase
MLPDDFLNWSKVEHSQKPASYARIDHSCRLLKKFFGETKVDRIEQKDIEKFILWRSKQTSSKTKELITRDTINNELIVLKTIFKRLVSSGVLGKSPAQDIKQLAANERSFHVLSNDEEKKYLLACPQPLSDVAAVMLETGMRCGEVYRLRRQDIYLDKGFLKVVKGKTKTSVRNVHLSEKAKEVLRYRMEKFGGENLFPQGDKDFQKPTESLDKQHLTTIQNLGYKFRLYDCRHTFATRAVENGVDLVVLASILGHSSLRMVMRYSHPSETFKADAIKRMEKAIIKEKTKAVSKRLNSS